MSLLELKNRFVSGLLCAQAKELTADSRYINLSRGQILSESASYCSSVYFPISCLIGFESLFSNGQVVSAAEIGPEGMFGVGMFLGDERTFGRAAVQIPGEALEVPIAAVRTAVEKHPLLHARILQYAKDHMRYVLSVAACNATHTVQQRCARWLLLSADRLGTDTLLITQDTLARSLGARRQGTCEALGSLAKCDAIDISRGQVRLLDRDKLQALTCECYTGMAALL